MSHLLLSSVNLRFVTARVFLILFAGVLLPAEARSAEEETFPKILTLEQAESMLDQNHPDLLLSAAESALLNAQEAALDARNGLSANLSAELRSVDRLADPGHDFVDDSRALLTLEKPLYRFGATEATRRVIDVMRQSRSLSIISERASGRIAMMRAYFDVLVADYAYIAAFEDMTLKYLRFDDAREKMEQHGELAEVDVRELEAAYLDAFAKRTVTESEVRGSRLRLALALNRPDANPDQLVEPDLGQYERPIPDYRDLLNTALQSSPLVQSSKLSLAAAKQAYDQVHYRNRPTLGVRLQAAEYAEVFSGSRDQFRGSLYLDVPVFQARQNAALIVQRNAEVLKANAALQVLQRDMRIYVLDLVQQLEQAETELVAAKAELLFQELKLDKVRLQYEMEMRARIGSANADVAKAVLRLAQVRFDQAIVWEKIEALTANVDSQSQQ